MSAKPHSVFVRIVATALIAGAIAGLFVWAAHMIKVVPLIRQAEVYEVAVAGQPGEAHPEGIERAVYTLIADLVTAVGFAFILTGIIAISGREIDWQRGIVWGLAGFATFNVATSLGMPPELPGMGAGDDLGPGRIWWMATVACTAGGLGLIFFARRTALRIAGAVPIAIPHLWGAPVAEFVDGPLPAGLASEFAVASLISAGLFWMVLGGATGYLYRRLGRA